MWGDMNSLFLRHEFLIRRLHSLSGLVPVGAYMTVHLLVNSTILTGAGRFQYNVLQIHNLGVLLPVVEWLFIFLPIIFHAVVGIWIAKTGRSNSSVYGYANNHRYTWQRYTGHIAIVFIFMHVFHLHGWFHWSWWLNNIAEPLGMARFRPYNAASTLAQALAGWIWPLFYVIGILASVFHFANGIWTAGITWGVWVTPEAQRKATKGTAVFGVLLAIVGLSALVGAKATDPEKAAVLENRMVDEGIKTGAVIDNPHKRAGHPVGGQHAGALDEAAAFVMPR